MIEVARRRCAVTFCSFLALAFVTAVTPWPALAVWPFSPESPGEDEEEEKERAAALERELGDFVAELIRIRTVDPPGDEALVAEKIVALVAGAGIEARTVPTPGEGRAAVFARLPGSGGARPVVLLSHSDVVPADAAAWQRDPFAGEIADGVLYGRGALDAKGVIGVHVFSLLELARRDAPLERDVILLVTPAEEAGGVDGAGWLAREHAGLLNDAEFLLTEGGSIRPRRESSAPHAVPSLWGVTITEKSPCWLELSTSGTPGHGAAPRRDAAVPRLIAALDRVRRIESRIRVLPEVESMFAALAPTAPAEDRAGFESLVAALAEDSDFTRRFLAQPGYNALVRDTISITMLEGGPKTNVVPGVARARLDVRLLPGASCDDFVRELAGVIADPGVRVETLLAFPSRSSPADTALFSAIERVAHRTEPDAIVVPRMIGGFTDAHWFRELGVVSYGFVPRWIAAEDAEGVHGVDERVSLANLRAGVETTVAILEELAAPPAEDRASRGED